MKSCPFIKSNQSNKFCISARRGPHLFFSLIAVISISFTSNGFAQSFGGGDGGNNNAFSGPQGGLSTVSVGAPGVDGGSGSAAGGGGGGAGITGGNGGGSGGAVGGTGGPIASGGGGGGGGVGSDSGGGGGGGGGVGANVTTTSANSGPLSGGGGGGGGTGSACCATGSGGGGGAGGFGAIVNSAGITYTNSGSIVGGNGGDGGAANSIAGPALANGGNGGSGGVGVYLGNLTTLINSGTVTGGAGGAGGAGPSGGTNAIAGPSAPGVYVASGSAAIITNNSGGTISGGPDSGSGYPSGAIYIEAGANTVINNSGLIVGSFGIHSLGTISSLINSASGTINGTGSNGTPGIYLDQGTVGNIINNGTINSANYVGLYVTQFTVISSIENNGVISGGVRGISSSGIIGSITNNGSIFSGIELGGGVTTIKTINNNGVISGGLYSQGAIGTITNIGSIFCTTCSSGGIDNFFGSIGALNNQQGVGNINGALTFTGNLPNNYNIIIRSPTSFGQLAVTSGTGNTAFGISSLSSGKSAVSSSPYAAVLSGITPTQLGINGTSSSSKSNGYSYTLTETDTLNNIWSLLVSDYYVGPSVANTNQSLVNTASALQGTYTLQNSLLANSFSYDCTVFGANDVCVSAGGRNTQVQAANGLNNTSALLIAAYRPHPNYRIGAYADQNLSVSNPGGTVNLGNNTPLIGLFAAWNERLDGTGTEVKVSAAYGQKNTTITRSVVGSGDGASEAGSGSSKLNSQGAQVTAKYGFGIMDNVIVSPYVGVRYTQNNMGGYTESTSSSVTAPLTYSALNTNATTALAGVGASYRVIPTVTTFASAGVETDTNTANGTYSATNASIGTLTPVNFNANPVKTRPTATVGAYYDIEKNQRVGITGIYRQEAYQAVSTTTVMATYTIGL
ncbi:autotransporter outer membrane beta-barrel domain-containing protein [Polynucleobacter paneuropaeus]|nr:autotransporter outer membrane beta-barrel domain-containing protein [Polynucleobacter paneuropaeus]